MPQRTDWFNVEVFYSVDCIVFIGILNTWREMNWYEAPSAEGDEIYNLKAAAHTLI